MRFVSLFSGIGGMDLGLERAGWECVAQVEWDDWCTKILEKHWPSIPRWRDIHDLSPADLPACDAIVGGFPCQPVSLAGKRQAQDDDRWLWPEFYRIVRAVRPRIVVVENVPGLASAGMGDVLGDLASCGYDAEWQSVPAAAVGAPHLRWRFFIVAYPNGERGRPEQISKCGSSDTPVSRHDGPQEPVADSAGSGREGSGNVRDRRTLGIPGQPTRSGTTLDEGNVADANSQRLQERRITEPATPEHATAECGSQVGGHWAVEPDVGRVAHGIPARVDRLRGLGNAVVPQVAEWVGNMINQGRGI